MVLSMAVDVGLLIDSLISNVFDFAFKIDQTD